MTHPLTDLINQIMDTLPPYVRGRDRKFHFEPDGTLIYEREEGDWEPPRLADGFQADQDNPWCQRPLWSPCAGRLYTAVRFPNCGCIGVIARCNEPKAMFTQRVMPETCKHCSFQEKSHAL